MTVLPIQTRRLTLRTHHETDAAELQRFYGREDVARFLLEGPWSADDAVRKIAQRLPRTDLDGEPHALALVIELDRQVIGDVALWLTDVELRVAEIGWVLNPEFGGKGYAMEAVNAVLDTAFDHYRVHRVVAQMDARNTGSAKLASNVGMRQEAHFRQSWWSKGEWTDTLVFGMLAEDRQSQSDERPNSKA